MSIALLATDTTVICRVVKALYDAAPGYTYLQNFTTYKNTNGLDATVNALASAFSSQTNAELAATVCTNLGLTGTAYTAGVDYLTGQFNATTAANRGVVIKDAMNGLANLTGDATFGAAADAFNTSIGLSEAFSTNSANTSTDLATLQAADDSSTTTSFSFTTSADNLEGTSGNDVFTALASTTATFNAGDQVDGKGGDDVLNLTANASGLGAVMVSIDNVETVNVRTLITGTAFSVDAFDWNGVTKVTNASSLEDSQLRVSGLDASTTVELSGEASSVYVDFKDLDASAVDSVSLSLDGFGVSGSAGIVDLDYDNSGMIDSVSISVAGANYVSALTAGANASAVTLTGAGTINVSFADELSTLDASELSGSNTLTLLGRSNVAVTGGSGDDTIAFGTTLTSNDSVDGGAGTDKITATVNAATTKLVATNVENATLNYGDTTGTVDASASSVTTYTINSTAAATVTMTNLADDTLVDLNDADLSASVLGADEGATLNIRVGVSATAAGVDVGDITTTGATTIDLTAEGSSNSTVGNLAFKEATDVNIHVAGEAGINALGVAATAAVSFTVTTSGSADVVFNPTGSAGLLAGASSLESFTLIAAGSEAADIQFGDASAASSSLVGGDADAGAKLQGVEITLTASNGADIFVQGFQAASGGLGDITITAGASSTIAGGSAGSLGAMDFIAHNTATMGAITLVAGATAADINVDDIIFTGNKTGQAIDSITIYSTAGATVNVDDIVGSAFADIGAITVEGGGVSVIGDIGADTIASISFNGASGSSIGQITADTMIGNIDIVNGKGVTITGINTTTLGDVTVSGSASVTIGAISATTVGTIDATEVDSGDTFSINLHGVTNGVSVFLGAGTNTVTTGKGADVITLESGTGTDKIRFINASAAMGWDTVENFQGSGSDVITLDISALDIVKGTGAAAASANAATVIDLSSAGTAIHALASEGGVFVISATAFDSVTDMRSAVSNNGRFELQHQAYSAVSAATAVGNKVVVWTDGTDTYLTALAVQATTAAMASGQNLFTTSSDYDMIVTLEGLDLRDGSVITGTNIQLVG